MYRPLADLASSRIIGAEALPRWPWDGADVPHQELLAAAETARVTTELGDWMLRESCAQAAAWARDGWAGQPVAALPAQAGDGAVQRIRAGCAGGQRARPGCPHPPGAPEVLAEGGAAVLDGLGELRERGVRLAVDVSGAG